MPDGQESFDDDELFDLARSAVGGAAVPHDVIAAARAAFGLRSLDAELAALIYDSRADERLLAGMRAPADASRVLVFRTGEATLEMEFADGRALGQIDPPVGDRVELESPEGPLGRAEVDGNGCFSIDGNFSGLLRVRLYGGDRVALVTEWARM
ncbi:MAG: hypothetical protein JO144_11250 [Actinobacteria bacterium]|nr:hypothetical protein [Actinomycetota bacterium]